MAGRYVLGVIGLGMSAALWSGLALAHAKLVGADPAPHATVSAAQNIHLEFSEAIVAKFSSLRLTDAHGNAVTMMGMKARDSKSLDAMPTAKLAPGLYTVSWTAVSTDDGHKSAGSFSFTVR